VAVPGTTTDAALMAASLNSVFIDETPLHGRLQMIVYRVKQDDRGRSRNGACLTVRRFVGIRRA
jgi:hypothetical protein